MFESTWLSIRNPMLSLILLGLFYTILVTSSNMKRFGLSSPLKEALNSVAGSEMAQVLRYSPSESRIVFDNSKEYTPVVLMHGMGDYANNPMGMVPLKQDISKTLNGAYAVNIKLGDTDQEDQMATFFKTMDEEVDLFAKAVKADTNLTNGFNAIGFSQGNLIIRGYVEKYNDPPVRNFISVHGPMSGVAGFPRCDYSFFICNWFDKFLGYLAYTPFTQKNLAQSNYFRDPNRIKEYLSGCQFLPEVNNENEINAQYKTNFESLDKLVLVKALEDTMIFPKESEWFGFYKDGSGSEILPMNETSWYIENLFGLKTLDKAGKLVFETTPGNHLQISDEALISLVHQYFSN